MTSALTQSHFQAKRFGNVPSVSMVRGEEISTFDLGGLGQSRLGNGYLCGME